MIDQKIMKLVVSQCVEFDIDTGAVRGTPLGKIASFYYISHETVAKFKEELSKPDLDTPDLIAILSNSKEFAGLPV